MIWNNDPFEPLEELAFIPYGWAARSMTAAGGKGSMDCWRAEKVESYRRTYLTSDCIWQQMWVDLPAAARARRTHAGAVASLAYWARAAPIGALSAST